MIVHQATQHMTNQDGTARQLFGMPLQALTMDQALSIVEDTIERRDRLLIGAVNAAKIVNMRRDASLRTAVLRADMILADGMAVVWASRLLRKPLPQRVAGIDLMHGMLGRGAKRGHRVFCLGAAEDVLEMAVARIRADYPGIVIAGQRNGYFHRDEETDVVAQIRETQADMLFVAMSPPKKEVFLARWADTLNVPVLHGVGGAFDVLAGKVRRAPRLWQSLGLEWLYRVVQEPGRMWRRYLVTNTIFTGMVLAELLGWGAQLGTRGDGRPSSGA